MPKRRTETEASAEAIRPLGRPARMSIWYWSVPDAAIPPGITRPSALPASCEVATAYQLFVWSAMRWRCQMQTKLAASTRTAAANQPGSISKSDRQEVKTSVRLGQSR